VIQQTLKAYIAASALDFDERLLVALEAGEKAGGDKRGRQSAALKLVTTEDFPDIDLRVDDHANPLNELERLLKLWRLTRAPGAAQSLRPGQCRGDPAGRAERGGAVAA